MKEKRKGKKNMWIALTGILLILGLLVTYRIIFSVEEINVVTTDGAGTTEKVAPVGTTRPHSTNVRRVGVMGGKALYYCSCKNIVGVAIRLRCTNWYGKTIVDQDCENMCRVTKSIGGVATCN